MTLRRLAFHALSLVISLAFSHSAKADNDFITDFAGANVNVGERLFLETRFSQFFFTNCNGDVNSTIPGDPTVTTLKTTTGTATGPFAGQAMNCRQCHLVDEKGYGAFGDHTLGNRTYADFARRSPIPPRDDGRSQTVRNAQPLVDAVLPRNVPLFLHHDGQFASAHDLIIATLTGRNYGWKPKEYATAVHHIATVIREDSGHGYLATDARGGRFNVGQTDLASYANIFAGFSDYMGSYIYDPRALVPNLISPEYQLDMRVATDSQILDLIAKLIEAYMRNLTFSQDTNGVDFVGVGTPIFNGSPFDVFLIKNNLPRLAGTNETSAQYARRLRQLVTDMPAPEFVTDPTDGSFQTHTQKFQFGPTELEGLKIFLTDKDSAQPGNRSNMGNCATCHSLPAFTDFIFHNTGATQEEYDDIHGDGAFSAVSVPGLGVRETNYDAYLPPTPNHPNASGIFETPPSADHPGQVDLGLWNVYSNPDFPAPQSGLEKILPSLIGASGPQIETAKIHGRHFVFSGGNGYPGGTFYVLASATPTSPAAAWSVIATNTFGADGRFTTSNSIVGSASQAFYRISQPLPSPAEALPQMIARFKTPTVRDLSHSGPYMHTGRMDSFEDVISFYVEFSKKARQGKVRNPDPQLNDIRLNRSAIAPLAAFLRSLNEDYTD
jgi:cytochrome c peroxidase